MIAIELRTRIDDLIRKWKLTVEETSETETSFIAFGTRGHQPVVLKVVKSHGEEWRSGEVLRAFRGRAVVQVLEYVDGAVLLERAVPGESLVRMAIDGHDEEATAILADVIRRMAGCVPPAGWATVQDWGRGFDRYLATGDLRIPRDLLEDARRCHADLTASQRETRLLHGDLHHYNVLRDAGRGWLAIDPKGVAGEIEYEVGAMLRNPIENPDLLTSSRTITRRLSCLSRELDLDVQRALRWAFAQAVLSAIWEVEDGFAIDTNNPRIRLANTIREMLPASASTA
jgi:streptomycin 6-kinase